MSLLRSRSTHIDMSSHVYVNWNGGTIYGDYSVHSYGVAKHTELLLVEELSYRLQ